MNVGECWESAVVPALAGLSYKLSIDCCGHEIPFDIALLDCKMSASFAICGLFDIDWN